MKSAPDSIASVGKAASSARRPVVAYLANCNAPYRQHLLLRIAREVPQIELWSLFTHEKSEGANWELDVPKEINPLNFGPNHSTAEQGRPRYALRDWRKGGRVIRWLREHQVSALVSLGYNDPGRLRIIRWCSRHRVPCFIAGDSNIRVDRVRGIKRLVKRAVLSRILRRCAGALPSGTAGEAFFRRYGVPPERLFLFPLEPDYSLITQMPPGQVQATAEKYGLPPGRRRIVFSGRFLGLKRADLLIDAFASIADRRPEWDLLMIGDGPMRADWQARVPPALQPRVIWTGYLSEQSLISALYRASDVLVLPSETEQWALVINEAAAAGLAIVSSSDPGAAVELVRDHVNGRIFPIGDLSALTDCLAQVTDPEHIDRMKTASAQVLSDWRARADPIRGLRAALISCGVMNAPELR